MKSLVAAAILALIASGCFTISTFGSGPPSVSIHDEELKLERYENGRFIKSVIVPVDSPLRKSLTRIIEDKGRKWESSYVTYAPRTHVLRSKKWSITIHEFRIIVNVFDAVPKPRQVVSPLTKSEHSEVSKLSSQLVD